MKVAFSALIPKLALLLGLGALALGGCGGASSCSEVCRKATTCSSLPGVLGSEQTACVAACERSGARTQEAVRACIDYESCAHITSGVCGSW